MFTFDRTQSPRLEGKGEEREERREEGERNQRPGSNPFRRGRVCEHVWEKGPNGTEVTGAGKGLTRLDDLSSTILTVAAVE